MDGPGLLGGRYELRDILGFGGMAEVRDGWDTRLNRPVAIKLLHPGLNSQADVRERFKIEACAAAALNHPNIVRVYDFGDHDGTRFMVMERLPGNTLGDQIAQGPLSHARVYSALRSVLAALAAAHEAGMLHRDIKPGNILLTSSGSVKVADFGIAKTPGVAHTTTGQIVGTLAYLSPGRLAGEPASVADDLYAVGVVGYEALTGRKPFPQEDIAPLARAIIEDRPPPLTGLRPDVDSGLADAVERAMSRDPLRRFGSAEAMWAALRGGGRQVPMSSRARPPTRVLNAQPDAQPDAQLGPLAATFAVPPAIRRRQPTRARAAVGAAAAVLGTLAVAALALVFDPSSTTHPGAPEPVSISTSVPPPISGTAVPPPVVQPTQAPPPLVEPTTQRVQAGNGNGNSGHGHKKSK
jgi:serine/threonine protein kinase